MNVENICNLTIDEEWKEKLRTVEFEIEKFLGCYSDFFDSKHAKIQLEKVDMNKDINSIGYVKIVLPLQRSVLSGCKRECIEMYLDLLDMKSNELILTFGHDAITDIKPENILLPGVRTLKKAIADLKPIMRKIYKIVIE